MQEHLLPGTGQRVTGVLAPPQLPAVSRLGEPAPDECLDVEKITRRAPIHQGIHLRADRVRERLEKDRGPTAGLRGFEFDGSYCDLKGELLVAAAYQLHREGLSEPARAQLEPFRGGDLIHGLSKRCFGDR